VDGQTNVWTQMRAGKRKVSTPPPRDLRFSDIFSRTVENFKSVFYKPITRSYLRCIINFYSVISHFNKVMPY